MGMLDVSAAIAAGVGWNHRVLGNPVSDYKYLRKRDLGFHWAGEDS